MGQRKPPLDALIGPIQGDKKLSLYCLKKSQVLNGKDLKAKRLGFLNSDRATIEKDFLSRPPLNSFVEEGSLKTVSYDRLTTRDLFVDLSNRKIDCAIGDEQESRYASQTFLMTEHVFDLSSSSGISWIFNQSFPSLPTLSLDGV